MYIFHNNNKVRWHNATRSVVRHWIFHNASKIGPQTAVHQMSLIVFPEKTTSYSICGLVSILLVSETKHLLLYCNSCPTLKTSDFDIVWSSIPINKSAYEFVITFLCVLTATLNRVTCVP